jgi:hypothetical protein
LEQRNRLPERNAARLPVVEKATALMVGRTRSDRLPADTAKTPARHRLLAACLALAGLLLAAPEARAVVLTSGIVEVDDALDRSTIDIQYFDISAPAVNADFLVNVVAPTAADNIAAALFALGAGGDFSLIEIESGAPGLDSFVLTNTLGIGSYAFVAVPDRSEHAGRGQLDRVRDQHHGVRRQGKLHLPAPGQSRRQRRFRGLRAGCLLSAAAARRRRRAGCGVAAAGRPGRSRRPCAGPRALFRHLF